MRVILPDRAPMGQVEVVSLAVSDRGFHLPHGRIRRRGCGVNVPDVSVGATRLSVSLALAKTSRRR